MKVKIEWIGFRKGPAPVESMGHTSEMVFEDPISLRGLLDGILNVQSLDKIVLVNGRYVSADYSLQENDLVQIFSPVDGG